MVQNISSKIDLLVVNQVVADRLSVFKILVDTFLTTKHSKISFSWFFSTKSVLFTERNKNKEQILILR